MSKNIRNVLIILGFCANLGSFAMAMDKPPKKRKNIELPEEIRKSSRIEVAEATKEASGISALNALRKKKVWKKLHEQMRKSKSDSELSVADELNNLFEKAQSQSDETNKPLLPDRALSVVSSDSDNFASLLELAKEVVKKDNEQIRFQCIALDDGSLEVTEKSGSYSRNYILKMFGKITAFATTPNADTIVSTDNKNMVTIWKKFAQSFWVPLSKNAEGLVKCEERTSTVYRPIELGILENPIANLSINPDGSRIIAKHKGGISRKTTVWELKKFPYFEYQRTDIE